MLVTEQKPADPPPPEAPPAAEERYLSLDDAVEHAKGLHQQGYVRQAAEIYSRVLSQRSNHVDALHFLGVAAMQLGDPEGAEKLIRATLYYVPNHPDAHNNLGNVLKRLGKLDEAKLAYARALELRPDNPETLTNLGTILAADQKVEEAMAMYQKALALRPDHVEAHHNLGNLYLQLGDREAGLAAYRTAVMLKPYSPDAYRKLGVTCAALGMLEDAKSVFRKWVSLVPDNPEAQHMLAAAEGGDAPARGSDAYVKSLFDRFAGSFDAVLQKLDYRAPALVGDTLAQVYGEPRGSLTILDAGCGTGLGGPLLKPYARRLIGLDLSDGMIAQARRREVYDDFVVAEVAAYLSERPRAHDLITAIDAFCYIGDLAATARALFTTLTEGGHAIFTVERHEPGEDDKGYRLEPTGRYTHSLPYIEQVMQGAGLERVLVREEVLRQENAKPVHGLAVVVRRSVAA
jgi:predicted TPR repeat methyltransferase